MNDSELVDALRRLNALGQLASGVSHHVINAFATVVSNAEILRLTVGTTDPADPIATAEIIIRTSVEASGVARRLIDYSRSATTIGPGLVALDRLAAEVVAAERAVGRPNIAWDAEIEPVPAIKGDELQIRELLGHLIANAVEAMPAHGGRITLTTGRDPRGWVVVEVHDTGLGVPRESPERVVEPFFTTKPNHLGIGLSVANGIWRRHRGTMSITPRAGGGTTVRLSIEPAA